MKKIMIMIMSVAALSCAVSAYASDATPIKEEGQSVYINNNSGVELHLSDGCEDFITPDELNTSDPSYISLKDDHYPDHNVTCNSKYTDDDGHFLLFSIRYDQEFGQVSADSCAGSSTISCTLKGSTGFELMLVP